jgi:hypothetical protein
VSDALIDCRFCPEIGVVAVVDVVRADSMLARDGTVEEASLLRVSSRE